MSLGKRFKEHPSEGTQPAAETAAKDEEQPETAGDSWISYDLWIAGVQVTSLNMNDILADNDMPGSNTGKATYDPTNKVLTLDNVNISAGSKDYMLSISVHDFDNGMNLVSETFTSYSAIYSKIPDLTIRLSGKNSIACTGTDAAADYQAIASAPGDSYSVEPKDAQNPAFLEITAGTGLCCGGKLSVSDLTITDTVTDGITYPGYHGCFSAEGDLTVEKCTLKEKTQTEVRTYALYSLNGTTDFTDSTLTASKDGTADGDDIYLEGFASDNETDGAVTLTGSTVTANSLLYGMRGYASRIDNSSITWKDCDCQGYGCIMGVSVDIRNGSILNLTSEGSGSIFSGGGRLLIQGEKTSVTVNTINSDGIVFQ
ncbi:MAG TPA: hypothetical protein PLN48_05790 [Lachnospiraceae bacterium]|nr:hypothetical protein [Lachnospiraceae bacterium]